MITFRKQKSLFCFSPSFGKDSDDEEATEQLTGEVDVTFMPHDDLEISYYGTNYPQLKWHTHVCRMCKSKKQAWHQTTRVHACARTYTRVK